MFYHGKKTATLKYCCPASRMQNFQKPRNHSRGNLDWNAHLGTLQSDWLTPGWYANYSPEVEPHHYFCGQRDGTWQRMLLECDRHLWKFDGFCVLSILYFDSFEIQTCQVIGLFISVVFLNCEFPDCFIFFRRKSSPCFHSRSGSLWRCFGTAKHGTAWSWNKRCWFQV